MKIASSFAIVPILAGLAACSSASEDTSASASAGELRRATVVSFDGTVTREDVTQTAFGARQFGPRKPAGPGSLSVHFHATTASCAEDEIRATATVVFPSVEDPSIPEKKVLAVVLRNETVTYNTTQYVGRVQEGDTTYQITGTQELQALCTGAAIGQDPRAEFGMWNEKATQHLKAD